jgi:hypothetical protein
MVWKWIAMYDILLPDGGMKAKKLPVCLPFTTTTETTLSLVASVCGIRPLKNRRLK